MNSEAPRVRILSTGSEILQGLYPDTNAQQISRRLLAAGFRVIGHSAAPDSQALILQCIRDAMRSCDLVVMTGGLGPTEDDVTRFAIAELTGGQELVHCPASEKMMRKRFAARGYEMQERNLIQTMLPAGAEPILNHWGTAPGFLMPAGDGRPALLALPGPPREWKPMLDRVIERLLPRHFPELPARRQHVMHFAMIPESHMNRELEDLLGEEKGGAELTILANRGRLRLVLLATGANELEVNQRILAMRSEILRRIGERSLGSEGDADSTPAGGLVQMMSARGETLALAESCTGGAMGMEITNVPGSSAVYLAGYTTYSNESKIRDLGVSEDLINEYGAVSEQTARAMAEGARTRSQADWAVAITGVAGPGGGTKVNPVGSVWISVSGKTGTLAQKYNFPGDRETVRAFTVNQAMENLRRTVLGYDWNTMFLRD